MSKDTPEREDYDFSSHEVKPEEAQKTKDDMSKLGWVLDREEVRNGITILLFSRVRKPTNK